MFCSEPSVRKNNTVIFAHTGCFACTRGKSWVLLRHMRPHRHGMLSHALVHAHTRMVARACPHLQISKVDGAGTLVNFVVV